MHLLSNSLSSLANLNNIIVKCTTSDRSLYLPMISTIQNSYTGLVATNSWAMKLTIIAHRSNTVDFDILPDTSCTIYDQNGNISSSLFLSRRFLYFIIIS